MSPALGGRLQGFAKIESGGDLKAHFEKAVMPMVGIIAAHTGYSTSCMSIHWCFQMVHFSGVTSDLAADCG